MKIISIETNSWLSQLFVFLALGCCLLFITACYPKEAIRLSGPIMGTQYNITIACKADKSEKQWRTELLPVMQAVNQTMSTYISNSELSLFNQSRNTDFQPISSSMVDVFSAARRVSEETNGAFDVTVMPLVNLWGFGPQKNHHLQTITIPTQEQLNRIAEIVGFEKLELDKSFTSWKKSHQDVSVDFSGIAKGYAVDQVSTKLFELGCNDHLVDIGGELRASGKKVDGTSWRLAVEKPSISGGIQAVINISEMSVASSGDYRNFYTHNGKRFSHTIDPRTLKPIEHNLASVTVLDPIASRADALATAFMVMGNEALDFAEVNDIPAYFIFRSPELSSESQDQFQTFYSDAFEKFLVEQ